MWFLALHITAGTAGAEHTEHMGSHMAMGAVAGITAAGITIATALRGLHALITKVDLTTDSAQPKSALTQIATA